jgi:gliding motility-associated-like protein
LRKAGPHFGAVWLLLMGTGDLAAQCGSTINTFPYFEGFENAPAWTSGGNANDWAWGIPEHPLISSAAEGDRAWCVGGLTGTFYNYGQQSWLRSPCFDFSSLAYPHVSFALFWECERTYDGLTFQYSLDQGTSWTNVGVFDAPENCLNGNWFNTYNILNLTLASPREGWSGRVGATDGACSGGGGSAAWVTAQQCLQELAFQPSVMFRFAFGAGTTCNSYDGIAIDAFTIADRPVVADMAYQCADGTQVLFEETTAPCSISRTWDFGDPASGAQNTSTSTSPAHTFSTPGTYTVTLTSSGPCGDVHTVTRTVHVVGVSVATTPPDCHGNGGTATAVTQGTPPAATYLWQPGGATTPTITDLTPGTYTVTISGPDICMVQASGIVGDAPPPPSVALAAVPITCHGAANGQVSATASGGTPGYQYLWSPGGSTDAVLTSASAGTYTCTVTDQQGCTAQASITLDEPASLTLQPGDDIVLCPGASTTLQATATGGTAPYTLHWQPDGPVVAPAATTTYTVHATDANGCSSPSATTTVHVVQPQVPVFTVSDTVACAPLCTELTLLWPVVGTLHWDLADGTTQQGSTAITHCYTAPGNYVPMLTLTDPAGCQTSYTLPFPLEAQASPLPSFVTNPPVVTIDAPTFRFIPWTSSGVDLIWEFGDPNGTISTEQAPVFAYDAVGCYDVTLTATSTAGCTGRTTAQVCVEDEFMVFVPNSFTPNGDGINDLFGVVSTVADPGFFELTVFDRWGREVFHTTQADKGWTGTDTPLDVYAWRLRMHDAHGQLHERRGHVTLLR